MSNEKRRGLISTALAVLQPLALSWVAVVILAVLSYVLAASSPMLGDAPWQDAARLGSSVWLLALGGPLSVDGGTVGLIPLVVTACIWLLCRHFMRGAPIFDWVDVAAGTAAAGVTAGLLGLFALPGSFRLGGILGAMLIVAVCALASWWRHEPPEHRAWLVVRECWRMLWPMLAGIVLMALVGVVVAVVLGWDTIVEINSYYVLGTVGTISLSFVQLLYLPNLVVWAVAYISGAGFAVGSGSSFSSLSVTAAPLPALPVLGALPEPGVSFPWLLALPILLGLANGLWRAKNFGTLRQLATYGLGTTGLFMLLLAVTGALASGGIGPERMSEVGVNPPLFALILTVEMCGGLLIGLLLRNDQLREMIRGKIDERRRAKRGAKQEMGSVQTQDPTEERDTTETENDVEKEEGAGLFNGPGPTDAVMKPGEPGFMTNLLNNARTTPEPITPPAAATSPTARSAATSSSAVTARSAVTSSSAVTWSSAMTSQSAYSASTASEASSDIEAFSDIEAPGDTDESHGTAATAPTTPTASSGI